MEWLMVSLGGGIGATLRYSVIQLIAKRFTSYWSTVIVNLVGSYFLGILVHFANEENLLISFLTIGVLGGFTTFSTFSFDSIKLLEGKRWKRTFSYIFINLAGGILLFSIGWIMF